MGYLRVRGKGASADVNNKSLHPLLRESPELSSFL